MYVYIAINSLPNLTKSLSEWVMQITGKKCGRGSLNGKHSGGVCHGRLGPTTPFHSQPKKMKQSHFWLTHSLPEHFTTEYMDFPSSHCHMDYWWFLCRHHVYNTDCCLLWHSFYITDGIAHGRALVILHHFNEIEQVVVVVVFTNFSSLSPVIEW